MTVDKRHQKQNTYPVSSKMSSSTRCSKDFCSQERNVNEKTVKNGDTQQLRILSTTILTPTTMKHNLQKRKKYHAQDGMMTKKK